MTMKDRVEKAVELFKSGYNCSQSVVAAFADMYGFTQEQALRMSASFGGGIGRMRQTCGAACGMFLLAGLEKGAVDGKDREGKAANYALVQQLAEEFRKRNGSMICAELLLRWLLTGIRPRSQWAQPASIRAGMTTASPRNNAVSSSSG